MYLSTLETLNPFAYYHNQPLIFSSVRSAQRAVKLDQNRTIYNGRLECAANANYSSLPYFAQHKGQKSFAITCPLSRIGDL